MTSTKDEYPEWAECPWRDKLPSNMAVWLRPAEVTSLEPEAFPYGIVTVGFRDCELFADLAFRPEDHVSEAFDRVGGVIIAALLKRRAELTKDGYRPL